MASETGASSHTFGTLFRVLVAYRMLVYLGGLIAIGTPLALRRVADITLSPGARTAIVIVSLGLMILTYIGERRVGREGDRPAERRKPGERYSFRLRASIALAALGIAVGIYVALEVNRIAGLLFIVGAYFFGYMGYRTEEGTDHG
jgi:hypothetical protein